MPRDARWLMVGADGAIGSALANRAAATGRMVIRTTRRPRGDNAVSLDLAAEPADWQLPEQVDVAFLCAAATSIDACRARPVETRFVNVERTMLLVERLAARGAFIVFLSTNQVFDGSVPLRPATDSTCPVTEYGRQKADAEREILGAGGAVVRLTKVVSEVPPLFRSWEASLRWEQPIEPFADMVFSPVPMGVVTEALIAVGSCRFTGIVQVSGERDVPYAEVGQRLAERLEADPKLVRPVSAASRGVPPEAAPRHTTLDPSGFLPECGIAIPPVRETIETMLDRLVLEPVRKAA